MNNVLRRGGCEPRVCKILLVCLVTGSTAFGSTPTPPCRWFSFGGAQRECVRFGADQVSVGDLGFTLRFERAQPSRILEDTGARVYYRGIYPYIDAVFYQSPDGFEYDVVAYPGSDPSRIRLSLSSGRQLSLDSSGNIRINSFAGQILHARPVAFQETPLGRKQVRCRYRITASGEISFDLGPYDPTQALVIDPVLKSSFGLAGLGAGFTDISSFAVDSAGYVYVAGITNSTDFVTSAPGTPLGTYIGANANYNNPLGEVFVRKIDPLSGTVIYSVLFGTGNETPKPAIALDGSGNAWIVGRTTSPSFPVTRTDNASTAAASGQSPIFVVELNSQGTAIVLSRLLGGSGYNAVTAAAAGQDGGVWLTGYSDSTDFPVTPGALGHAASAIVVQLNSNGGVEYSTTMGTGAQGSGIAIDAKGDAYVTGNASEDFPTTPDSYAPYAGEGAFAIKFDHASHRMIYSTFLPGALGPTITVDDEGDAYVSGTAQWFFPTTPGAFQMQPVTNSTADAFVLELNPGGTDLVFSTRIGGSVGQGANGIALAGGSIVVAGSTSAEDFPANDHSLSSCGLGSYAYYAYANEALLGADPSQGTLGFVASFDHAGHLLNSATFGTCLQTVNAGMAATTGGVLVSSESTFYQFALTQTSPVQISKIVDGASFIAGSLSPLEVVTIFGQGLGPKAGVMGDASAGAFSTSLAGTTVTFNSVPAPLLYVSDSQVNAVVPSSANSVIDVSLVSGNGPSPVYRYYGWPELPAIFTANGSGTGPAAVLNQDGSLNSERNPAARGSVIVIFGTGCGLLKQNYADGQLVPTADALSVQPVVLIAGELSVIAYAGAAPSLVAGVVQINVRIPDDIDPGPAVPLQVSIYPLGSQDGVTIAVK